MSRSFWNSCPKSLEYFPESTCSLGERTMNNSPTRKGCSWAVNSEEDHYCFWSWIRRVSNDVGQFEALHQHQISTLLKCSSAKTPILLKDALEKLKKLEEFQQLKDLFE